MSILLTPASSFAEQKSPAVIVIGAGIAGLTAAYRLHQKGFDVHVYDAKNRVGGRIFTAKIGGHTVELGGQNITDGGEAENILRLIDEFGLELTVNRVNLDYSYFDGEKLIPRSLYKGNFNRKNLQLKLAEIAQKSQNMQEVFDAFFEEKGPLYKSLSVRLAAFEGGTIEKLSPLYTKTLYHMLLGGVCAAHQSTGNYVDLVSIKGGNALLPESLATSLGNRVHLNMPLVAVSKTSNGSYELLFPNEQKAKADILVLAIPCSVYDKVTFDKNLIPEERLEAIKNVQYGTNAKLLIPFSQEFLEKETLINDRCGCFFDLSCNILTLYYTGESGRFSAETVLKSYEQELPMLEMAFGDRCPPVITPAFARDESFASYEGPVGYSWPNDPYIKGTYSYIAPGQEMLLSATHPNDGETVRTLFAPLDRSLYFAGEHASILMEVPGTLEAACESGERTVRMINNSHRSLLSY